VRKSSRRLPKNHSKTAVTTRHLADILASVLSKIEQKHVERHDLILSSWPAIVGPKIAAFSVAESFDKGYLRVKVKNSTLFQLLNLSEKAKLLSIIRKRFPNVEINGIFFRMG